MDLEDKKVVVVGFKRTGAAVARFLVQRKARVIITDMAEEKELRPFMEKVRYLISQGTLQLELGGHKKETFEKADLIIVSPGVSHTILPIKQAKAKNIPVMGEIELASRFIQAPIVAISGTNGKTTATELLKEILHCSKIKNFVGGNIGNPLIEYLEQEQTARVVVVEISSFQLDTAINFKPKVGVLLNITDDHLDRYDGIKAYAASKSRLFMNQGSEDIAIFNQKDLAAYPFLGDVKSKKWIFNVNNNQKINTFNEGGAIGEKEILLRFSGKTHVIDVNGIHLAGRHNLENIAAVSLAALAVGASIEDIQKAVRKFEALPHRLAYVDKHSGVAYYNDSKATNVDAVMRAIKTFDSPLVLIMGGRDKGGEFHVLKDTLSKHVKTLVVIGEAADMIADLFKDCVTVVHAKNMQDAVDKASQCAQPGDTVLLSPGCASFDMFDDYIKRGQAFEAAVNRLK